MPTRTCGALTPSCSTRAWRMGGGCECRLAAVPKPVAAVVLLFPVSDGYLQYRRETEAQALVDAPGPSHL